MIDDAVDNGVNYLGDINEDLVFLKSLLCIEASRS